MPFADRFPETFEQLSALLRRHTPPLRAATDTARELTLVGPPSPRYPQYPDGVPFGSVRIGARYVSYHLMPVYAFPDLLDGAPARLRQRMQGKSCFNFTRLDPELAAELAALTAAGAERYREAGLL